MQMPRSAKTSIILDTRRIKKNGLYPVKLRVTFERKQKYYPTPYDLTEKNFKRSLFGERQTDKEKELKKKILAFENKAIEIIEMLPVFAWHSFEKHYLTDRAAKGTLELAFSEYIEKLKEAERIGTAVSYECAQRSLSKFAPGIKLSDINNDFLQKYEKWMLGNGNSVTTVGIYLRSLRTLFNNAIAEGQLTKEYYPFGKRKYEIPTANNIKKALSLKDITSIYYFKPADGSTEAMAKDLWIFMYLCSGINVKDMCLLRYSNIKNDMLEFERAKTVRTKRNIEPIRIPLSDDAKSIIRRWGNKKVHGDEFIFPILSGKETPERQRQLIQQLTKLINCRMKVIADKLNITTDITTYVARHSFATILQRSGASTEFISEALGHSNIKTTKNYLAGFEDEKKKETFSALTAFKNIMQAV
ncbi:MAG: hypothetical protein B6D37_14570 [Sphingobacteriales bacterium UTBCD1]|jgi:integrase|nr:MAG: hypothetical protein B6D37_14570 [Sphingobacteriales bacterium UTBCD1]